MKKIKFKEHYVLIKVAHLIESDGATVLEELPEIRVNSTRISKQKATLLAIKEYASFDNVVVTGIEEHTTDYEMDSEMFKEYAVVVENVDESEEN